MINLNSIDFIPPSRTLLFGEMKQSKRQFKPNRESFDGIMPQMIYLSFSPTTVQLF